MDKNPTNLWFKRHVTCVEVSSHKSSSLNAGMACEHMRVAQRCGKQNAPGFSPDLRMFDEIFQKLLGWRRPKKGCLFYRNLKGPGGVPRGGGVPGEP